MIHGIGVILANFVEQYFCFSGVSALEIDLCEQDPCKRSDLYAIAIETVAMIGDCLFEIRNLFIALAHLGEIKDGTARAICFLVLLALVS